MNYTVKIHWWNYVTAADGVGGIVDEATHYIPADSVIVQAEITDIDQMKAWQREHYFDYRAVTATESTESRSETHVAGRLIQVTHGDNTVWYIASKAWLIGPEGKTIERLAP